jgi:hypothetical protein
MTDYAYADIFTYGLLDNVIASVFEGIMLSEASINWSLRFLFYQVFCLFTSAGTAP